MNISYNECKARDLHNMTEWCPGCQRDPKLAACNHCCVFVDRAVACDECEDKIVNYNAHRKANTTTIVADHGVNDAKGRAVGGRAYIRPHYHSVTVEGQSIWGSLWLGEWEVSTGGTRDGNNYGASGRGKAYDTREAAEKAAHAALARQAKRYQKQFGGG